MPRFDWATRNQEFFSSRGPYAEALSWVAYVWRRLLPRTRFVAITGSVGKTTAKEAAAAVLAKRFAVQKNHLTVNADRGLWRTILRVKPWHHYAVLEVGTSMPGKVRKAAVIMRPDIAVVLAVKWTHRPGFRTLEATALEKSQLLSQLKPGGAAVLNADDPRVAAIAVPPRCRIMRFGQNEDADVRVSNASAAWPDRLSFDLSWAGESVRVSTKLVGDHWLPSLGAAAAVGRLCGVSLAEVAGALAAIEPTIARCEPVRLPSGAIVIRDEYNGSIETLRPAMELMSKARAKRRVVVWGDYADTSEKPRRRMRRLGEAAAGLADLAVFVGERADLARQAAEAAGAGLEARAFVSLEAAAEFLRRELREGDLVLLKGRTSQHLSRLFLSQFGEVACRKPTCAIRYLCDHCDELGAGLAARAAAYQRRNPLETSET